MTGTSDQHRDAVRGSLSVDQRVNLARKVDFNPGLSGDEQKIIGEILLMVAQDAEIRVRQALSETLAASPHAPRGIVQVLAKDDALVAAPVLKLSQILTQDDLIELIMSQMSGPKMEIIADRDEVPPPVCLALIEHGDHNVTERLLQNPGADISEAGYGHIVDRHGSVAKVQSGLVDRDTLPPKIIEKVVAVISRDLLGRLIEQHDMPATVTRRLIIDVRDRAILGFSTGVDSEAMTNLVDQLVSEERLTPSLVFRSLVVGNLELVAHVIALECRLSPTYVREHLAIDDASTLREYWKEAGLPPMWFALALTAVDVLREARGRDWSPGQCRFQIIERFTTNSPGTFDKLDAYDFAFLEAARGDALADLAGLD